MPTLIDNHVKNDPKRGVKVRATSKGQHLGKGSFNGHNGPCDPYKFSATKGDLIVTCLFTCPSMGFAAASAGISRDTLRAWLKRSADDQKHQRVTALSVWKNRVDEMMGKAVVDIWQDLRRQSKKGSTHAATDMLDRIEALTAAMEQETPAGDDTRALTTEKQTSRLVDLIAKARARQGKKEDDSE